MAAAGSCEHEQLWIDEIRLKLIKILYIIQI